MIEICARGKCVEIGRDLFEEALRIRMEAERRGDLTTKWWRRFMTALFTGSTIVGATTFSFTDVGGTSRSQYVKRSFGEVAGLLNTIYCNNRFWISVGNVASQPTIDDYKIGYKLAEAIASISSDDAQGVVILSAGFQFASDTVIYEVGLEWEATVASHNTCGRFLVDRTVISGGSLAPANVPVTVTYRILV
jgi:hypothetical protein